MLFHRSDNLLKTENMIPVIAPFYNEETILSEFITRLIDVMERNYNRYEILLVDDGSTDSSFEVAKKFASCNSHIKVISFSRNYGHEIALTAGIDYAGGEYVVQMDSDLQHPPELIPELINKIQENYDIVYAARSSRAYEGFFKRALSLMYYRFARALTGFSLPDNGTNFRVINKKVLHSIKSLKENHRHLLML